MTTETPIDTKETRKERECYRGGASEAVYGLGLLGAWFYYFTHAATFWIGVLGFFKGLFWPAMLVYEVLKYLNM